ncbi:MAG: type II toxin-antitoxin system ParD family antitoxin [Alphaproteobacteria bacterium]|jgi:antitoxin ParD1/3/4|nr:type II toxin-antitoxin system ParD family antitoxin [Alphaproteobacteria bacterium]MDP6873893.1 type II toxin-antitoxin system ParD family antitoxin [Alphaproteobacteria bacterium]
MTKYSITMSDDLGSYVQGAMNERKFDTASEYFRHLVRQDYVRQKAEKELRALIDEGLKSGVSDDTVEGIWAEAIAESQA